MKPQGLNLDLFDLASTRTSLPKMGSETIVLGIVAIGLAALCIYFIYLSVQLRSQRLSPDACPKVSGYFGVNPGHIYQLGSDGLAVLSRCGTGAEPCVRTVTSLSEAVTFCNENVTFCEAFVYTPDSKTVMIVDPTQTLASNPAFDLYTRQYPTVTA